MFLSRILLLALLFSASVPCNALPPAHDFPIEDFADFPDHFNPKYHGPLSHLRAHPYASLMVLSLFTVFVLYMKHDGFKKKVQSLLGLEIKTKCEESPECEMPAQK